MDTSETYIKMRLAAIPDLGRGTSHGKPSYYFTERAWVDVYGNWYYTDKLPCQLERQDQLQEMMADKRNPRDLAYRFALSISEEEYKSFASMEQLWLAFVMKEEFQKVWTDEGWKSHEAH